MGFKVRAIKGDGDAAYRLYIYYNLMSKDGSESIEWLIIGARLGHGPSIRSLKEKRDQGVTRIWIDCVLEDGAKRRE